MIPLAFEFSTAQRIIFGSGALRDVGSIARNLIERHCAQACDRLSTSDGKALVVTGRDPRRSQSLLEHLSAAGVQASVLRVEAEPTVALARDGAAQARREGCALVIGFGGGSALDLAKAIAALAANPGDVLDYLEVVGKGQPLECVALPCMAIPTTAGTGSEVTRNAVLASPEHAGKASLRHASMLPDVALVDPQLTHGLPPEITASTGLDALTQLIEPFVSLRANPMTDGFCREGLQRSARSLVRAFRDGEDAEAREDLALASLLGGLALANAGLGAVHGLAAPLGGLRPVPHGVACAALLSHVTALNIQKLRAGEGRASAVGLNRYAEVARILTGRADAEPEDGVAWITHCIETLRIPGLGRFGVQRSDVEGLAAKGLQASSMKGNPVQLLKSDLEAVLLRAL